MTEGKVYKKVFFEMYTKDGYGGRFIYQQRNKTFTKADIPILYERRPYKDQEAQPPKYLYRIDKKGIHIALLYDGAESQWKPV